MSSLLRHIKVVVWRGPVPTTPPMTTGTSAGATGTPILGAMERHARAPSQDDHQHSEVLSLVAAAATLAAVALASVLIVLRRHADGDAGVGDVLHVAAFGAFALAFIPLVGPWRSAWLSRAAPWGLSVATLAATIAVVTLPQSVAPVLFILTAALAAHVAPQRVAAALVAGQTLVLVASTLRTFPEPVAAVIQTVAYGGFQVFALTTSLALITERSLRQHLALVNAELSGARALLESASRQGERLRIARELHDLVGHHLTALSLQLEVADHLVEGCGREPVERARAIARLLLADVRDVVSDLRERDLDLSALLRAMVAELPRPHVSLDLPESLGVEEPERAQVVLRLVQEALTNAVRHGAAEHVWISLRLEGEAVLVEARDDGRGIDVIRPGNGLRGMRERVAAVGGQLQLASAPGAGFTVRARLPLAGGTA